MKIEGHRFGKNTLYTTKRRTLALSVAMALFALYLCANILRLQTVKNGYYRNKVFDQITTTATLKAQRGHILDRDMNVLATGKTTFRVFVSTRQIKAAKEKSGDAIDERIAAGLASLLSLDEDTLLKKIRNTAVLDVTVKKGLDGEEYARVIDWIGKEGLSDLVFTEAQYARDYPENTLAAHVLGFVGSDSQGLYGLEYQYDSLLRGEDGHYLYAKDAAGNELPIEYATYVPAKDGYSLVTTLDSYIQQRLEYRIEQIRINHDVENRVCGIVMDTKTGAILAMATSSPFDPNDPYTLDSVSAAKLLTSGYAEGSDEYKAYKKSLLEIMWSNKAVGELYEPGSTFKIVTVAAALDSGAATMQDLFSCSGSHVVGGRRIRCHKTTGHGSGFTLAYGLQMSCNPTMMQIAERTGADTFYDYVARFGYFKKTGIDLPSEASSIFHKKEALLSTELATASFGQRFKVTLIQQLTAVAAVANGGIAVKPYVVERIIDADGNTVQAHESTAGERIISESVANEISKVLCEGVSGEGGAKNAAVEGYEIAAKTGTSQKFDILDANGNSYLRIGSTVGYSKVGDGGVAIILMVDEPTTSVKYGSVVAAPYIGNLFSEILPYLGQKSSVTESTAEVPSLIGKGISEAKALLSERGIRCEVFGDGKTVLSQTPSGGEIPIDKTTVLLFTEPQSSYVTVESYCGLPLAEANERLMREGFSIVLEGIENRALAEGATVTAQSIPPGTAVKRGERITLRIVYCDFED
ncbi:MAG: PASTA domain-containing protein [Clostridia bacterium]|nr:PASTA domain-containing protein [Clostridia bacterium]